MRGILVAICLIAFGASGCFSSRRREIERSRLADIEQIRNFGLSKMVAPQCNGRSSPPSEHVIEIKPETLPGARISQRCGTIADEIWATETVSEFVAKVCGGQDGPECLQSYWKTFLARLGERYEFTDWAYVSTKCQAHPIECQKWWQVELWAMEVHNESVLRWARSSFTEANAHAQLQFDKAYLEEVERRHRVSEALQNVANTLQRSPTVHCTSTTVGYTTSTNCR
jgi:hypothetical protein